MFARPYVDQDEWRNSPVRHRYVHGGFEGTDTRFSFYLPPASVYEGRFFQYITPIPLSENISQGATGEDDKIRFTIESGAYFVETNGGGRGVMGQPGSQVDSSISAYRANAAAANYSRIVAMEMYACERPYGYAFGGSGGAYRTIGGMENTEGVWDGAVPFVPGSPMAIPNVFSVRMYAMRILGDKFPAIVDAIEVGSEVDPYNGLNAEEAAALTEVTKMGFPLKAWYTHDILDLHGLIALYPGILMADPSYFSDFWTKPGYEGYDAPASLRKAKIQQRARIKKLIFTQDVPNSGIKEALVASVSRGLADDAFKGMLSNADNRIPVAIEFDRLPTEHTLGSDVFVKTGEAAGQRIGVNKIAGNFILVSADPMVGGSAEVLKQLQVGDDVEISNLNILALQTYHRHQVPAEGYPVWDQFRDEQGNPIYPQRPMLLGPRFTQSAAGILPTGNFKGKMILLSNLYDTEAYPWQGDWYRQQAQKVYGDSLNDNFRLWYTDHANHGDSKDQSVSTQTVSYLGVLQQALRDISAWVEKGIAPAPTSVYEITDGQVQIPATAAARQGIQPVIDLLANAGKSVTVRPGEEVQFTATVVVPTNAGRVVDVTWDFDGSGVFAEVERFKDPQARSVALNRHRFEAPGTYFVTVRAAAQRQGDGNTEFTRIQNLDRVRVVVGAE
ncbi:hypothetical protein G8770_08830 [Aestuariicella hydrocarbonica]|uniref:PKD domain-containing protein n=2 Tax=Pseudomaricurvus hydrocarbonicus TaxID=1470433 RepID=A0A9E5JRY5_9GAMM|nr:hypothetical protein [Aestuariicella hydrocarbonica]